jgi:hypothetical protein
MFIKSVMRGMTYANPNSSLFTVQVVVGILFEFARVIRQLPAIHLD